MSELLRILKRIHEDLSGIKKALEKMARQGPPYSPKELPNEMEDDLK